MQCYIFHDVKVSSTGKTRLTFKCLFVPDLVGNAQSDSAAAP